MTPHPTNSEKVTPFFRQSDAPPVVKLLQGDFLYPFPRLRVICWTMYGVVRQASIYYAAVHAALPRHVHAAGSVGCQPLLGFGRVFGVADRPQGGQVRRPLVRPCGCVVGLEELVHLLTIPHRGPDGPPRVVLFRVKIGGLALLSDNGCAIEIGGPASQVKGVCLALGFHDVVIIQIFHASCTPS